ncbi:MULTISPECIES: EthD family reductase [unclassified Iodidimonas]|jgi:uncharacterized protein (TIGR02118 family)|uniref:EthD family reductase n=1 Tax=unclassified Iodidimonas TaxID=2626145 RepID=UPI002482E1F4|nr:MULTISPECIES: EthD family reductase [unclassified Iodidimonas]
MSLSLQVLYPQAEGTHFDHAYYNSTHMAIVARQIGAQIESTMVIKGLAGGPDTAPPFHAIATIRFADQASMDEAMTKMGPAVADIPNFYNGTPLTMIGEIVG